jgi:hypothetical protein
MGFQGYSRGNIKHEGDLYLSGVFRVRASTYLLKLASSSGIVATPSGAVPGATRKKLRILVDGTEMFLLAADDWVNATSSTASSSLSPSASRSPSSSASKSPSPSHV